LLPEVIYIYENIEDSDGVAIYDKFMSLS